MSDRSLWQTTVPSPEVPDLEAPGIAIAAAVYRREDGRNSIGVRGIFRYPLEALDGPTQAFRKIAILLVSGSRHLPFAFSAGKDKIVFEDDVRRIGDDVAGVFEFDAFEESGAPPAPGEYFLSAMIGPYLSEVRRIAL